MKKIRNILIAAVLTTATAIFLKWFLFELDVFLHPPHDRVSGVLTMLRTAQHAFYAEQGYYAEDIAMLGVPLPESKFFIYRIPALNDTSFTISAVVVKRYRKTIVGDSLSIDHLGCRTASGWLKKVLPDWSRERQRPSAEPGGGQAF